MKKKIAILGSTGSIGTTSLNIFKKNKNKFDIILLAANTNYSLICKQIKMFKPKYYIISNKLVFKKVWQQPDPFPYHTESVMKYLTFGVLQQ